MRSSSWRATGSNARASASAKLRRAVAAGEYDPQQLRKVFLNLLIKPSGVASEQRRRIAYTLRLRRRRARPPETTGDRGELVIKRHRSRRGNVRRNQKTPVRGLLHDQA